VWGNFRGKNIARRTPVRIFQSAGLIPIASNLIKTSLVFGVGTGISTCCLKPKIVSRVSYPNIKGIMLIFNKRK